MSRSFALNGARQSLVVALLLLLALSKATAQPFYVYTAPPGEAQTDWNQVLKAKNAAAAPASDALVASLKAYQSDPRMGTAIDVLRHYKEMSGNAEMRKVFLEAHPRLFQTLDAAKYELVMQTQRKMKVDGKPIGYSWRVGSTGARHQEWLAWKRRGGSLEDMPTLNPDKQFQSDDDISNFLDPSRGDRFDERELINGEEAAKVFMDVTEGYAPPNGRLHPSITMVEFLSPTKAYGVLRQHIPGEWSTKYEVPTYLQAWVSSDKEKYNGDWAVTQLEHWAYDVGVVTTEFGAPGATDSPVAGDNTTAYRDRYAQLSPDSRGGPPAWPGNDLFGWMSNQHRQVFDTHGRDLEEGEIKYLQKYTIKRMKTAWENIGLDLPPGFSDGDMSHTQLLDFNRAMLVKAHEMHVDLLSTRLAESIRRAPEDVGADGKRNLGQHVDTEVTDVNTEVGKSANALAIAYSNLDPETLTELDTHLDEIINRAVNSIEGENQYRADVAKYLKATLKTSREGGSQLRDQAAAFRYARSTLGQRLNNHLADLSGRTLDAFLVEVATGRKFVRDPAGVQYERQLTPQDVAEDLRVIEGVSKFFGWSDADMAKEVDNYFKQDLSVGIQMLQKLHRITSGQWAAPKVIQYRDADGNVQQKTIVPSRFSEGVSFGVLSFKAALKYGQTAWGYYGRVNNGVDLFKNLVLIAGPGVPDEDVGRAHAQIVTGALGLMDVANHIETNYGKGLGVAATIIEAGMSLSSTQVLDDRALTEASLNLAKDLVAAFYPPVAVFSFIQGASTAAYSSWSLSSSRSDLVTFVVENGDWEFDRSEPGEGRVAAVKDPKLNGIFLFDGTTKYLYTDLNILAKKIRDSRYAGGYRFLETKDRQIDPREELLNVARRTGAFDGFEPLQIVKTAVNEIVYAWGWKQWVTTNFWDKNYTEEWVKGDLLVDVSPMQEDSKTRVPYTASVAQSASNSELSIHIRKNAANLVTEFWVWQQQILEDKVLPEIIKEAIAKKLQDDMEDMPELVWEEQVQKLDARMVELDKRVWPVVARSVDPYPGEAYSPDTDIAIAEFYKSDPMLGTAYERAAIKEIVTWVKGWPRRGEPGWEEKQKNYEPIQVWTEPPNDAIVAPIETIATMDDARRVGRELLVKMTQKAQSLETLYNQVLTDAGVLAGYVATSDKYAIGKYHLGLTGSMAGSPTPGDVRLTSEWAGLYREERKTVRNDIWARNPGVTTPGQSRNPTVTPPTMTPQGVALAQALEWSRQWFESIRQRFLEDYFANLDATETHPYFPYLTRLRYQLRKLDNLAAGAGEMSDAELAEALGAMKLDKVAVGYDPAKDKAATISEVRSKMREEYTSIISNLFNLVGVELTLEQADYKLLGKYKVSAQTKVKEKPSLTVDEIAKFITGYRWTLVSDNDVVMNVTTRQPELEITPIHAGFNHIQCEPVTQGGLPLGYVHQPLDVGTVVISGELQMTGSFKEPDATVEVLMGEDRQQLLTSPKSVLFDVELDRVSFQDLLDLGIISKLPEGGGAKRPFNFVAKTTETPPVYGNVVGAKSPIEPGKIELDDVLVVNLNEGVTVFVNVVDLTGEPIPNAEITIRDNLQNVAKSPPGKLALPLLPGNVVYAEARLEEPPVRGDADPVTFDPMQRTEIKITLPVFMPGRLTLKGTVMPPPGESPPAEIASGDIGSGSNTTSVAQGGAFTFTNAEIIAAERGFEFDLISLRAATHRLIRAATIPWPVTLKLQEEQDPVEIQTETFTVDVDPIQILPVDWTQQPIFDNPRMTTTVAGVPASKEPNVFRGKHNFKYDNEEVTLTAEWGIPEGPIKAEMQLSITSIKNWETKPVLDDVQNIILPVYLPGNVALEGEIKEGADALSDIQMRFPTLGHSSPIAQSGQFTVVPQFPLPRRSPLTIAVEALAGDHRESNTKDIAAHDENGVIRVGIFDFGPLTGGTDHDAEIARLGGEFEKERDAAIAACEYEKAAAAQRSLVAAVNTYLADRFSMSIPAPLEALRATFQSDLTNLEKAAEAERVARDAVRRATTFVQNKDWEAAAQALTTASGTPDLPSCTQDKLSEALQKIDAKLAEYEAKIAEVVAKVEACELKEAQALALPIATEVPLLSWVRDEYPKIQDLAKRDGEMLTILAQARASEKEGEALASSDARAAILKFNAAIDLVVKERRDAPECRQKSLATYEQHLHARAMAIAGGQPAPTAAGPGSVTIDRTLLLVIDVSGSMQDQNKIDYAKSAAISTVRSLGPNVEVGLVSYSGGCSPGGRVVQGLTTDKDVVVTAIEGLSPGGGTPMAPAINFARNYMEQNASSRAGQMIVLSDGQNDCGSVSDAGGGLARSSMNIKLDAVGLGLADGSQADKDLQDLVRSSGGTQYSASNSEELVRAFRRASVFDQVKWDDPYVDPAVRASLQNLFQIAAAHLQQNDYAAASAAFKYAADQHPGSPAAHHNYSLALEAEGQLVGAIQEGEKYLQLAPNAFDAGSVRARIDQLRLEVAENPRAIFSPHLCNDLYQWARDESNRQRDAGKKAAAFRIMTAAQRGDCEVAAREYETYTGGP